MSEEFTNEQDADKQAAAFNVYRPARWEKSNAHFPLHNPYEPAHQPVRTPDPLAPTLNSADIDIIRAMIKSAVDEVLYPGGMVNAHEHRRIEMTEENGDKWRGVLYAVEKESI